jgi:hypothetical protein
LIFPALKRTQNYLFFKGRAELLIVPQKIFEHNGVALKQFSKYGPGKIFGKAQQFKAGASLCGRGSDFSQGRIQF